MSRRRFVDPAQEESIRPDRIGSLLLRIIQERLVRGFADPRIRGLVSVTAVEVTPDLRSAIVRVSVMPAQYEKRTLAGLRSVCGILRREVRDQTALRKVPELEFRIDDSLKHAAALDDAIREGLGDQPESTRDHDSSEPSGSSENPS